MSYSFSGQSGPFNTNLHQPFSGYSNGSIASNGHHNNAVQRVQKLDNGEEPSQSRPQYHFDESNPPISHCSRATAMNQSTSIAQSYQQQAPPQQSMQNAWSHNISSAFPVDFYTNKFWTLRAHLELPGGQSVDGTFAELYQRYASSHKEIWRHYNGWHARKVQINQQAPTEQFNAAQAMAGSTNATKSTKGQGKRPKLTPALRKPTRRGAAAAAMYPPPAFFTDDDLDTPQKCRDYLAYIDPADVHAVRFEDDDWEDVLENRKNEFIGEMFEALTHPYAQDPPAGIALTMEAREKYHKQQDAQTAKVLGQLQTAPQIKAAKALCSLLFDAAVYVHEVGVPKEVYDGYQWYTRKERQVDRKYRLDLESICSKRLEKIVVGVKANKLIAMDVLEQTNFHRIARDPEFYHFEKFTYLRSNKTRQENIDRHNKQDEEDAQYDAHMSPIAVPVAQSWRKRRREAAGRAITDVEDEDGDGDVNDMLDDVSDEEFDQSFQRMRR